MSDYPDTPSTQADRDRVVAAARWRQQEFLWNAEALGLAAFISKDTFVKRTCLEAARQFRLLIGEEPTE